MYAKVQCAAVCGIDGQLVEVETDVAGGLPQVSIVGLPDSAVRESTDRVRTAIRNCGYAFPQGRVTINLAPADLRKEGASYDLAIALGILLASGQWTPENLDAELFIGELALDGSVRPVPGMLNMILAARDRGIRSAAVPAGNAEEARLIAGMRIIPVRHLKEVLPEHRSMPISDGEAGANDANNRPANEQAPAKIPDYADVYGQSHAKRALTIAAAGMHNVLFIGPPGAGKTMLMRRLPSILPPLTEREALELMQIYSVSGLYKPGTGLWRERPFRAPHHTISHAGLLGGGNVPKPGEVSLAHRGVLFLDELPEFSRHVLDALRQPLEDQMVTIARARMSVRFPTHFLLAAAMNPCPCGMSGIQTQGNRCTCTPMMIARYRRKLSGPLLDRIDLQTEVPPLPIDLLTNRADLTPSLTSAAMREKVMRAQTIQRNRYAGSGILFNSELSGKDITRHAEMTKEAGQLLKSACHHLSLSARAYERILKMARTIADLDGNDHIDTKHAAEAVQYRAMDRFGGSLFP